MNKKEHSKLSFLQKIKKKVSVMKQDTLALYYAFRHHDTPWPALILIWLTIGYLLSPIDLIPDFIPILGLLDDLIIVPLLIIISINLIPKDVWKESLHRAQMEPIELKKSKWFMLIIAILWILGMTAIYVWVRDLINYS